MQRKVRPRIHNICNRTKVIVEDSKKLNKKVVYQWLYGALCPPKSIRRGPKSGLNHVSTCNPEVPRHVCGRATIARHEWRRCKSSVKGRIPQTSVWLPGALLVNGLVYDVVQFRMIPTWGGCGYVLNEPKLPRHPVSITPLHICHIHQTGGSCQLQVQCLIRLKLII